MWESIKEGRLLIITDPLSFIFYQDKRCSLFRGLTQLQRCLSKTHLSRKSLAKSLETLWSPRESAWNAMLWRKAPAKNACDSVPGRLLFPQIYHWVRGENCKGDPLEIALQPNRRLHGCRLGGRKEAVAATQLTNQKRGQKWYCILPEIAFHSWRSYCIFITPIIAS